MASAAQPPVSPAHHDLADLALLVTGGLGCALIALFVCVVPFSGKIAGARDFVVFWATAQQLVHHGSPYDVQAMTHLERAAGLGPAYGTLFMRNPPWALPLVLPLGLVGVRLGALLWTLALLACMAASVYLLTHQMSSQHRQLQWLGYSFTPALICLFVGQTTLFSLLGLALFLYLHRSHPVAAGASLWLCLLKPHLFVPFGIVLVLWALVTRSYRILAGVALSLIASSAAAWYMMPQAWTEYLHMLHASTINQELIPCLSDALRLGLAPGKLWLQYLPLLLACAWAIRYYWRCRKTWDWNRHGHSLMLVSLLAAPYCWLYDQCLAIPALFHAAQTARRRTWLVALAALNLSALAELLHVKIASTLFLWTMPAWLIWYLLALFWPARRVHTPEAMHG